MPEYDLDSQTVRGTVGASVQGIVFYVASDLTDPSLMMAYNAAVQANVAKNISVSLGGCETAIQQTGDGSIAADDMIFQLAVYQGQTFSVATGDAGAAECYPYNKSFASVQDYPATSPYVVAVGGTSLLASDGQYQSETPWSGSTGAGGGGPSLVEPQPSWQNGIVPGTTRGVPDVSFDADPSTGAQIIVNGKATVVGGTSLSAPLFAGLYARLQTASANQLPFPGQHFYHFPPGYRARAFHDVTSGSNAYSVAGSGSNPGYNAAPGWDYATGYGSLNMAEVRAGIMASSVLVIFSYLTILL